ncbi:MAG: Flp family type IVb pilin [Alphaproteobacteria bacterium]|nr:Flp family type IVb pilin [Alphaproteobacteria bacterium]
MRLFLRDEQGATAIEYGLIAALMATGLLIAMPFLTDAFLSDANKLANALK